MIKRKIRLNEYDWCVVLYIGYTAYDADTICRSLETIGCKGSALTEAHEHLANDSNDSGLTYSNVQRRVSIVAVGASESQCSIANTIGHELLHVVAHICEQDGIDMLGEEPCYIIGQLCEDIFKITR